MNFLNIGQGLSEQSIGLRKADCPLPEWAVFAIFLLNPDSRIRVITRYTGFVSV